MRPRVLALFAVLLASACDRVDVSAGIGDGEPDPIDLPPVPFLRITHVDVGQGDATLVEGPSKTMLVDAGDNGMGSARVLPFLEDSGIPSLDYVVATHPHADHVGGLDEVLAAIDAKDGVWDNGEVLGTQSYEQYAGAAALTTGGRRTIAPGTVFDLGSGAKATCYAVNGTLLDGWQVYDADFTNDRSVVLVVEWGSFRYVLAGDLGGYDTSTVADVESSLAHLIGDVDVLRVSHHGSRYSTNPTWLNTLRPEVAVISAGDDNDYGHPSSDTLGRLTGADTAVTIPPPDLYLTQKGTAPSPFTPSGNVVIDVQLTNYRVENSEYDPSGG